MVQAEEEAENAISPKGFLSEVFGGQLSSRVACEVCNHTSVTLEPFMDLSLPIPAGLLADMDDSTLNRYTAIFTTCLRRYNELSGTRLALYSMTEVLGTLLAMLSRRDASPLQCLLLLCCQGLLKHSGSP